jgi:hypothetical protein
MMDSSMPSSRGSNPLWSSVLYPMHSTNMVKKLLLTSIVPRAARRGSIALPKSLFLALLLAALLGVSQLAAAQSDASAPGTDAQAAAVPESSGSAMEGAQSAPVLMAPDPDKAPPPKPLVRIGEEELTYLDLMSLVSKNTGLLRDMGTPQGKAVAVKRLIDANLVERALKEEGLLTEASTGADIQEAVKELEKRHYPLPPPPAEEVLKAFYEQNRVQFGIPEMVRAERVSLPYSGEMTPEEKAAVGVRAEAARAELLNGAALSGLSLSEGEEVFAATRFFPVYVLPWLSQAIDGLASGGVSEVVDTGKSFDVVRLLDRRAEVISPFEDVRPQIESMLSVAFQQRTKRDYLIDLANQFGVVVHEEALRPYLPYGADSPDAAK